MGNDKMKLFMDLEYTYTYLLGSLLFMVPWTILFFLRKDLRKEMLVMSFLMSLVSFITAYLFWTIDWWKPDTITSTRVGIEDLILGFSNGGIAAVIYEELFKKRFSDRKKTNGIPDALGFIFIMAIFMFSLFYFLGLTSFISSSIAMIISIIFLTLRRKDLFYNALVSGILMCLISIPIYLILIWIYPGWIEKTWLFDFITGIKFLGIPIEDLIFYFLFGFVVGPFYELWQGYRVIDNTD